MNRRRLGALALCLCLALGSGVAWAEDEGAGQEDIQARIKKKMAEILELMAENERALLELSTGSKDKPRRVDVEIPDVPEGASKGGASSSGAGGGGSKGGGDAPKGEDIARRLRELIEGQRGRGERIPKEMEQLLRMIPKSQGKGQGQPKDGSEPKGDKKDQTSQDLRDGRKQLDEQKQQEERRKRERGEKSKPAQSAKMKTGKPEDDKKSGDAPQDPNTPVWFTALPPEIRDALAGGQAEKIPQKYRHLIARYNLALQKGVKRGR